MKHIHLIGIGGTGLSAIARVLIEQGYTVSGSDRTASPLFNTITAAGAQTFQGHAADQIAGADLVIRSSAIPDDNPEVRAAHTKGIPVLKRSDFMDELTKGKDTLAVAGSHGKTTTTAMLIWVLDQLGNDPSFIAGSMLPQLECNARAGAGPYFAIEADEYDHMFLGLSPKIAIITNIEYDHPDCFPTKSAYRKAFKDFLKRIRSEGLAVMCLDDPQTQSMMEEMKDAGINMLGYGTSSKADYQINKISTVNGFPRFTLTHRDGQGNLQTFGLITLNVPGYHNVLNASAVLGVIHQLGLPMAKAINALQKFSGTSRRFEVLGEVQGITIIDDYGHHPTEIVATINAARSRFPEQRIWAIWEPHTYSRTQMLESDFIKALNLADRVVVLNIYASREVDPGYTAEQIATALPEGKAVYIHTFSASAVFLLDHLAPQDVAIVFSAGNATEVSQAVLQGLQKKQTDRDQQTR